MNFQTLNKQRKFILIAALVGVVSVFLPWFSAGAFGFSIHINGFHGWGILAFICFIAAGIISFVGDQLLPLYKTMWFATMICGTLALLSIIITLASSQSTGSFGIVSANFGFGIWIALAAAAGVILFAWMYRNPAHDLKSGFESIKNSVASTAASISNNVNTSTAASKPGTNKIEELEKLSKLKESGTLTEEEFQQLKSKLL